MCTLSYISAAVEENLLMIARDPQAALWHSSRLPAQVTEREAQRHPALDIWRHIPAARVQVLQSSRPTPSVFGLGREVSHALQRRPPALQVRTGTAGERAQQQHRTHLSRHLHLSDSQPAQPVRDHVAFSMSLRHCLRVFHSFHSSRFSIPISSIGTAADWMTSPHQHGFANGIDTVLHCSFSLKIKNGVYIYMYNME